MIHSYFGHCSERRAPIRMWDRFQPYFCELTVHQLVSNIQRSNFQQPRLRAQRDSLHRASVSGTDTPDDLQIPFSASEGLISRESCFVLEAVEVDLDISLNLVLGLLPVSVSYLIR